MKKLSSLLSLTGILWSCNNHRHVENKDVFDTSEAKSHQHGQASEKLVMNNIVTDHTKSASEDKPTTRSGYPCYRS
jgi:23S rRNA G2069 N7-methylase RlmK/C1962 C5-methylase RlmI